MTRVGLLGGGQLAQMLGEAALRLGLSPQIFAASSEDPALMSVGQGMVAPLSDSKKVGEFLSQVDLVAFESDFLPFDLLNSFDSPKFFPRLQTLALVSDKTQQKKVFADLGIETPAWRLLDDTSDAVVDGLLREWQGDCVFKWARGGYDGKGVFIWTPSASRLDLRKFISEAEAKGFKVFCERKIHFSRELAMVAVRSTSGEFAHYPLVVSQQRAGICRFVEGPATALGVSVEKEKLVADSLRALSEKLDLVGCFAVEFFEAQSGAILANEIAPRVHNSGHSTLDASETSQFENHWRALLGRPLGSVKSSAVFMMMNLVGAFDAVTREAKAPAWVLPEKISLKWYNKSELRAGRKMGHLNAVSSQEFEREKLKHLLIALEARWLNE